MRGSLPWAGGREEPDPHERLLVAVLRQTVVDARAGMDDAQWALEAWGFPSSTWQPKPAQRLRQRAGNAQ